MEELTKEGVVIHKYWHCFVYRGSWPPCEEAAQVLQNRRPSWPGSILACAPLVLFYAALVPLPSKADF
jgi:hypothetical protein